MCARGATADVHVDEGEQHDRVVTAEVAVRDDTAHDRRHVEPEAVELRPVSDQYGLAARAAHRADGEGDLLTLAQCAGLWQVQHP